MLMTSFGRASRVRLQPNWNGGKVADHADSYTMPVFECNLRDAFQGTAVVNPMDPIDTAVYVIIQMGFKLLYHSVRHNPNGIKWGLNFFITVCVIIQTGVKLLYHRIRVQDVFSLGPPAPLVWFGAGVR